MNAVLIADNGYVVGVYPNYTPTVKLNSVFVLVNELPPEIAETPPNHLVKYVGGEFVLEDRTPPDPEPTPEQQELADLKQRTEDLEILIAEIILGG